jgi:hypothetical protein
VETPVDIAFGSRSPFRAFLPFFTVAGIRLLPQANLLPFFPKKQSKIPFLGRFPLSKKCLIEEKNLLNLLNFLV